MIDVSNIFGDILPILYDFLQQFLHILFVNVISSILAWWCDEVKIDRWLEEKREMEDLYGQVSFRHKIIRHPYYFKGNVWRCTEGLT